MWKVCPEGSNENAKGGCGFNSEGRMKWWYAVAYAKNHSYAGYQDWRIPTLAEYETLSRLQNNRGKGQANCIKEISVHGSAWTLTSNQTKPVHISEDKAYTSGTKDLVESKVPGCKMINARTSWQDDLETKHALVSVHLVRGGKISPEWSAALKGSMLFRVERNDLISPWPERTDERAGA